MSVELSTRAQNEFDKSVIEPQLVLEIDGVDNIYSSLVVKRLIKYGDSGLVYGGGQVYGGKVEVEFQEDLISLSSGTSTGIKQTLNSDKGKGSSVSGLQIQLVDFQNKATELITPGQLVEDLLGRKAKLYYGPNEGFFKDDFFVIFRGIIDDISSGSGFVTLNVSHPDQKRRGEIFTKASSELNGAIDSVTTTILVDDASDFLEPITGPDLLQDGANEFYIRIDDELIQYTGISGNNFTGVVRGALGTTAVSHNNNASVESIIRLQEDAMDLALKLMLSGWNDYFIQAVPVESFNRIDASTLVDDAIFFDALNIVEEFGLTVGDYFTTTGAINGANDVTLNQITDIVVIFDEDDLLVGSYLVSSGAGFVEESASTAEISFRSRYDTLADGLKMSPDEVDVAEHLRLQDLFLASFDYDFKLVDSIKGKDFIDSEIYLPAGAFSIPRKAKSSVGIHTAPLPGDPIKTIDVDNVLNASAVKIRRTTSKNFYNTIIYKYDKDIIEDRFLGGVVFVNATSLSRIPVGRKPLIIESNGMTTVNSAQNLASIASNRLLKKFKFGAEFVEGIQINFKTGVNLEIGDIVVLDLASLKMTDIFTGSRSGEARLFQVDNWQFNFRSGQTSLTLVDTSFDKDQRRGLVGPCSPIKAGLSTTQFIIEPGISSTRFGQNEFKKWEPYIGAGVRVRSVDFATTFSTTLKAVDGNTITVEDDLGFTPLAGYVMELSKYNNQTDDIKLRYVFATDNATFDDGKVQYTLF